MQDVSTVTELPADVQGSAPSQKSQEPPTTDLPDPPATAEPRTALPAAPTIESDHASEPSDPDALEEGRLLEEETLWAAQFEFLKSHGYLLRPRYRPGWVASWLPGPPDIESEDAVIPSVSQLWMIANRA